MNQWLHILGLQDYWPLFEKNSYSEPNALADLKLMDRSTLSATFEMTKPGHIKKLTKAIKQLKYPTTSKIIFIFLKTLYQLNHQQQQSFKPYLHEQYMLKKSSSTPYILRIAFFYS